MRCYQGAVGGVTEASTKDRRTLGEGVVTVVALVDADTGALTEPRTFWPGASSMTRRRSKGPCR